MANPYDAPEWPPRQSQQPYGSGPQGPAQYGPAQQGAQCGGPPPYGYGYPPPAPRGTNAMAVTSMIVGILWLYWIGSILALIFGYVARSQIRRTGEGGGGMAIAGIVLGWIGVGVLVIFVISIAAGTIPAYN